MTVRACSEHGCTLLDDEESCPAGHFVTSWLIVQDGKVIAEADETSVRWFRNGKLDDQLVPDPNLRGRRKWSIHAEREPFLKRAARRRKEERARAKKEGREPAAWAQIQSGTPFSDTEDSFMRNSKYKARSISSEEAEA